MHTQVIAALVGQATAASRVAACCRAWAPAATTAAAAAAAHCQAPVQARGVSTSSCDRSSQEGGEPKQQQQQQQQRVNVQQEAQEMSKAFMSKSLSMEELWFSAVGGKLKVWSSRSHPELKGKEQEVLDRVQAEFLDTLTRAATGRLLTNRSRIQLKQACLAAATYRVLAEAVPSDEKGVEEHIADCMGGLYAPFMLGGLKFSSWVRRVLLRQSSISQAVDTLHTVARDMEGACHCSVQPLSCASDSDLEDAQPADAEPQQQQQQQQQQDGRPSGAADAAAAATPTAAAAGPRGALTEEEEAEARAAAAAAAEHHSQYEWHDGAALTVDACMFSEVLHGEGVPQLLRYFCCQHNMSWLEAYKGQGVDSRLEACIAKGDACCRVVVAPAEAAS